MAKHLIIGGHGKVALRTAPLLAQEGHQVTSVIRNPDHATDIEAAGATPLIQLLASAEDQTDNVYRPLQAMARHDRMQGRMRVGEQFIRLPNDGRIDVVTSSALSLPHPPSKAASARLCYLYG